MKRKLLSIFFMAFLSYQTNAQEQKHRISLFTDFDAEIVTETVPHPFIGLHYQYALTKNQNLAGYFSLNFDGGTLFGADYIYDIPIKGNQFEFNIGAGLARYNLKWEYNNDDASIQTIKENYNIITGMAGFTYNFTSIPLSIFATYKPKLDFPYFDPVAPTDITLGIGYRF